MRLCRVPVAAVAGIAVLAGGCTGSADGGPPEIELDRATAAAGAAPLEGTALPAGGLRELWRADLPGVTSTLARAELVAGQAVVVSPRGVDAVDARTGKTRWHYYEKERAVLDYAVTDDTVVLTTAAAGADGKPRAGGDLRLRTTALDAGTGKTHWNEDGLHPVKAGHDGGIYQPIASAKAGIAVFEGPGREKPGLIAKDARTGKQRWTWTPASAERCSFIPQQGDGSLLVVEAGCGALKVTYALDPESGDVRWKRESGNGGRRIRTQDGVTLVTAFAAGGANVSTLVAADGKAVWELEDEDLAAKEMAVVGDRAVLTVSDHGRGYGRRLEFVDVRTGKVTGRTDGREHAGIVPAGERAYGVRQWLGEYQDARFGLSPGLVPAALDMIDPVKGEVVTVPLPFASAPEPNGEQTGAATLIKKDRLLRVQRRDDGSRLVLYGPGERSEPLGTGGVPASDWPDACGLAEKASRVRDAVPEDEPLRLGDVKIPGWRCQARGGGRSLEFWIGWVANDAEEAEALLAGSSRGEPSDRFGDEAYLSEGTGGTTLTMRTGRYIVVFERAGLNVGSFHHSVVEAVDKALR